MKKLASLLAIGILMASAPAYAQESVKDGYGGKGTNDTDVLGEIGEVNEEPSQQAEPASEPAAAAAPAAAPQVASNNESLPFTGADAGLIGLGGLALIGVGFAVRHASRPTEPVA